jgi:hypothetical protein
VLGVLSVLSPKRQARTRGRARARHEADVSAAAHAEDSSTVVSDVTVAQHALLFAVRRLVAPGSPQRAAFSI